MTVHSKPRDAMQRNENKQTMALARSIRAKIELRIQAEDFGFFVREKSQLLWPYYQKVAIGAKSAAMKQQFRRCLEIVEELFGDKVALQHFTPPVLDDFARHLSDRYSQNTASVYYTKLTMVLRRAHEDGLLKDDPTKKAKKIYTARSPVVYLEEHEVAALLATPCESDALKRAVILSIHTGLRLSDVERLTGSDVFETADGPEIRVRQKKTSEPISIPITRELCHAIGLPRDGRLFPGVRKKAYNGTLTRWVAASGIQKPITYHKTRHTCAASLVTNGADIRVVQEILGHKDIKSTLVYAHVASRKKREAIGKISVKLKNVWKNG